VSLDVFWCEKSVAAKGIHAPIILTLLGLARGGGYTVLEEAPSSKAKMGRKTHASRVL